MLKKLVNPSNKKIKIAKRVYDLYCKINSLHAVKAETGLAIDTIRKYIMLVEDINNQCKISTKDRYYKPEAVVPEVVLADTPNDTPIYIYKDKNIKNINIDKNIKYKDNINSTNIDNINNKDIKYSEDIITNDISKDIKLKDKILINKLNDISKQYLEYLENPSAEMLNKTSLRDRGIIAGILLDKKILLTHKAADKVANQSIIFNLFGNNKSLSEFISGSMDRQKRLEQRPVKQYTQAINK
jgi:hypothetical protein